MKTRFTICLDFDGVLTLEDHWPQIKDLDTEMLGELDYIHQMGRDRVELILFTCREGELLELALRRINNAIPSNSLFDEVNTNSPDRVRKFGFDCRKISADLILDDKALGWDRSKALTRIKDIRRQIQRGETEIH